MVCTKVIRAVANAAVFPLGTVFLLAGLGACGEPLGDSEVPPGRVFLAVGDTGEELVDGEPQRGQMRVGRAMARRDSGRRVRALVFLGDNFYPDGLLEAQMWTQVRGNLALPYCHFGSALVRRFGALRDCGVEPSRRNPVPWFAVAGNHDHRTPGSVARQHHTLPTLIPNWEMGDLRGLEENAPLPSVRVFETDFGVSLIAIDSTMWQRQPDRGALVAALGRARGPWRIVITHHPVAPARGGGYTERPEYRRYQHEFGEAVARAGVPVHLVLSGHDHYLAATSTIAAVGAAIRNDVLNVIAGSGSSTRHQSAAERGLLVRESVLGFAEVELGAERLAVALRAVRGGEETTELDRFEIGPEGRYQRRRSGPEVGENDAKKAQEWQP